MSPQTTQTFLRFNGDWPTATVISIALVVALLMFFYYRRELRFHTTTPRWVLPALRSLAVLLIILCLAGPVLRHEETFRQLGRVLILADASASMDFSDETSTSTTANSPKSSRFDRLQQALLLQPNTLIQTLAQEHNVELFALRGSKADRLWWHRDNGKDTSGDLPSQIAKPNAPFTNLDQPLRDALGPSMSGAAIILLTDGQHNAPGSPEALAEQLGSHKTPIFTVGYGLEAPPPDLALSKVTAPEAIFPNGRAEGLVHINDHLPAGLPAVATITSQNKTLWQQNFTTEGTGARQIPFSFLAEELAPSPTPGDTLRNLNVRVELSGENAAKDRIQTNNETSLALHLLTQKRKILILDGRPRWETRYLHSHFDRDQRWQVTTAFDDFTNAPNSSIRQAFPKDDRDMQSYDLVILGDLRSEALQPAQHQLLHDFVQKRGGGLILLDGQRGHLQSWRDTNNSALIPVSWNSKKSANTPYTHDLTTQGQTLTALSLSDSPSANQTLWEQLPKANWAASADALPDATTLTELQSPNHPSIPGMVWRRFGAGSVLWLATDEYWRWRYEVADLHHQRFWMQLASWIAAPPFIAEDKTLSIGMDQLRYRENDKAELRVRLRDADGNILTEATNPRVNLTRDGRQIATLQLEPDPTHGGVFRAVTSNLPSGDYSINVTTNNTKVSDLALRFRVDDSSNQEWSNLTLNRPLLESISRSSGGRFLRESDINQLPELLKQIDRQETRIRETLLWSSWWWFTAIILLLTTEWLLRKHWRLV
ncbi:hypothetical protein FEM03_19505 [Phragmitibacter flavus]|uniref:VWFA domain-containing protein n=1 Tax=Phragmitibacter flavus TaxID=2576071 RepID=A0A5R8K9V9_9BACT|nr:vWA domain-containing protein [Phragmitibacter flavus]TLD69057.1 hypothetical protein FEM03_19505 [Phragmitibacter flavus]